MKRTLIFLFFIILCQNIFCKIWYVSEGGRGAQDGTSWADAASDFVHLLQYPFSSPGLTQGAILPNPQDTIFVSEGTYSPILLWYDDSTKTNSFFNEIHIYGGFEGWEYGLDDRTDWANNPSIIDAKGLTNCIWVESYKDTINQYIKHIVIDGFILINGLGQGGAIRTVNETPLFSNLIIKDNEGYPLLYFENARDTTDRYLGNTILNNCLVHSNRVIEPPYPMLYYNSLVTALQSDVRFTNNTIVDNITDVDNTIIFTLSFNSTVWVDNSIIFFNAFSGEDLNFPCNIIYRYSDIENCGYSSPLWTLSGTDGGGNIDDDPKFKDFFSGDYHLSDSSPCIDEGNYSQRYCISNVLGYQNFNFYHDYDIEGNVRVSGLQIDMGVYEYLYSSNAPKYNNDIDIEVLNSNSYDKILLYDLIGRVVAELTNIKEINTLYLAKGIYCISFFKGNSFVYSDKIIINN